MAKPTKWTTLLNRHRFMNNLSLDQMAERVGLTRANYWFIEKGTRAKPKYETFQMLAIELNMTIEDLQKIYYESYFSKN